MEQVTHSVVNVVKRILTVALAMVYFGSAWIASQVFGVLLANLGVLSYGFVSYHNTAEIVGLPTGKSMAKIKGICIIAGVLLLYLSVIA